MATDGTLYVACHDDTNTSARKINVVANPSACSGQYTSLAAGHSRIAFTFSNNVKMYGNYIAGDFRVGHNLQMAADPTDPNVLCEVSLYCGHSADGGQTISNTWWTKSPLTRRCFSSRTSSATTSASPCPATRG